MEQTSSKTALTIPSELSNSLPIFQMLGDKPLVKMQIPESKKWLAKIIAILAFIGIAYVLLTMVLPPMIALVGRVILLTIYCFIATILYMAFGPTVRLLHRLVKIGEYKAHKAITETYAVETLRILLAKIKDTLEAVHKRITTVDAIRLNMISDSELQSQESEAKFEMVRKLTKVSGQQDSQAIEVAKTGDEEKAGDLKRQAMENRVKANTRKAEGEAAKQLAAQYAQYANGLGKAIQGLKNNETSMKIQYDLTNSSVTIIENKLKATSKMREATQGLADILQIQDTETFNIAMAAVNFKVNDNIANVNSNLEFLSDNRLNNLDVASQEDLEAFVNKLDSGAIKTLDVAKISSPYHELTKTEKVDKTFNLD